MVVLISINKKKREFFRVRNIMMIIICGTIIRMHIDYKRILDSDNNKFVNLIKTIMDSDILTYFGLFGVTIISYFMVSVMRRFGATTRPILVKLFLFKNSVTFFCLVIYWFQKQGYFPAIVPASIVSAQIIYLSTFGIFVIQMIGLFIPKITSIVDPEQEKNYPLKRIKESLFFILFNIVHVFVLIGGPNAGAQYVLMFSQIFTFFEV